MSKWHYILIGVLRLVGCVVGCVLASPSFARNLFYAHARARESHEPLGIVDGVTPSCVVEYQDSKYVSSDVST